MSAVSVRTDAAGPRPSSRRRALIQLLAAIALILLALLLFAQEAWWQSALQALFPSQRRVLFGRTTLYQLTLQHLAIVGASVGIILLLALPAGLFLTRPSGRAFRPLGNNLLAIGQSLPPVAVLALALPTFGFGTKPALIALVAYGILPVTRNTIAGLDGVPRETLEAAVGMGMGPWTRLWRIELPLAAGVIIAGLRVTTIYTIGTTTVAPIIGAGGLGVPIIAGLAVGNLALVLQGALPVAILALLADMALGALGRVIEARS